MLLDSSTLLPSQFQYLEKIGMLGLMGVAIYFLWKEQESLKKSNAELINRVFDVEKKHLEMDARNVKILEKVTELLDDLKHAVNTLSDSMNRVKHER